MLDIYSCVRCVGLVWIGLVVLQFVLGRCPDWLNPVILTFLCTEIPFCINLALTLRSVCSGTGSSDASLQIRTGKVAFPTRSVVLHLLAAFIAAFIDMWLLNRNSAWCFLAAQDIEEMCRQTNEIGELFERKGIVHWLCHSSLLGAERNGKPIPFDNHAHICVLADDKVDDVWEALMNDDNQGDAELIDSQSVPIRIWQQIRGAHNVGQMYINVHNYRLFNLSDCTANCPNGFLAPPDTTIRLHRDEELHEPTLNLEVKHLLKLKRKHMPLMEQEVFPLGRRQYCGRNWLVPWDIDAALTTKYGENWIEAKLPEGVRGWACRVWWDGPPLSRFRKNREALLIAE